MKVSFCKLKALFEKANILREENLQTNKKYEKKAKKKHAYQQQGSPTKTSRGALEYANIKRFCLVVCSQDRNDVEQHKTEAIHKHKLILQTN